MMKWADEAINCAASGLSMYRGDTLITFAKTVRDDTQAEDCKAICKFCAEGDPVHLTDGRYFHRISRIKPWHCQACEIHKLAAELKA